jgi:hypothetical protein
MLACSKAAVRLEVKAMSSIPQNEGTQNVTWDIFNLNADAERLDDPGIVNVVTMMSCAAGTLIRSFTRPT